QMIADDETRRALAFTRELGVALPEDYEVRIEHFYAELLKANDECNLTRITDREDFLLKHVVDSLLAPLAFPALATETLQIADVGCGGGIPGIPLALAFPGLACTEIDSVAKKIERVDRFLRELGLSSSRAIAGRARELARQDEHLGAYDVVIARAVSETPKLIKECRRLLRPGGALLAYKTPEQLESERTLVEREAKKAKLSVRTSDIYRLPQDAGSRQFWILASD
ncbi:MAG: 16S rRNA (guanine(527)-N(7))-methyltransferase RsmG, partial [Planctomycetota bacterium]